RWRNETRPTEVPPSRRQAHLLFLSSAVAALAHASSSLRHRRERRKQFCTISTITLECRPPCPTRSPTFILTMPIWPTTLSCLQVRLGMCNRRSEEHTSELQSPC